MKGKHLILFGIFGFIIVGIMFNLISLITYQYDKDNCQNFLNLNYQVTTKDARNCIGLINHPIYNYYIPEIILGWITSLLINIMIYALIFVFYFVMQDRDLETGEK